MTHDFNFEDAILKQFAAAIGGNRREFYRQSPVLTMDKPMQNIVLPTYAGWQLIEQYGTPASVTVKIDVNGKTLGASLHGLPHVNIKGVKDGIPITNYQDAVAQLEYLCEDLRRGLLMNLAKEYKALLDKTLPELKDTP